MGIAEQVSGFEAGPTDDHSDLDQLARGLEGAQRRSDHPIGEITPHCMIFTPSKIRFVNHLWPLWPLRHRRYLGVAAYFL